MSILVLLWVGTLGIIYASSYLEKSRQNQQMLQAHAKMYVLSQSLEASVEKGEPGSSDGLGSSDGAQGSDEPEPPSDARPDDKRSFDPQSPAFQLSTFYTVALDYDGELLEINNESQAVHSDDELVELAKSVVSGDKQYGTNDNLAFYITDKGDYMLVSFMDNTLVNESAMTLMRYTLIYGGVALVLFFFLSVFLARKIVKPLEENYQKQKQFISDAGHELKTPVSVVSANAELLCREIGDNKWLSNIQYENERMGTLVAQLLELARTENVTPQMERVDLSRLVAGEVLPFESIAFEKGLSLSSDIADGISVEGNSAQLKQLVAILLDNAISHSKGQHAPDKISLTLSKEHKFAKLSVINKGDEIPKEQREQIFERFYRVDSARSGEDNHYGLGLAIAKTIATYHKAHIEVQCYDGLVEFVVKIPTA